MSKTIAYHSTRIEISTDTDVDIKHSLFYFCSAPTQFGGAVYLNNQDMTSNIISCVFSHCHAHTYGAIGQFVDLSCLNQSCFDRNSHIEMGSFKSGIAFWSESSQQLQMSHVFSVGHSGIGSLHLVDSPIVICNSANFTNGSSEEGVCGLVLAIADSLQSLSFTYSTVTDSPEARRIFYVNSGFRNSNVAHCAFVNNKQSSGQNYCLLQVLATDGGSFEVNVIRQNSHFHFILSGVTVAGNFFDYWHDVFTGDDNSEILPDDSEHDITVEIACMTRLFTSTKIATRHRFMLCQLLFL